MARLALEDECLNIAAIGLDVDGVQRDTTYCSFESVCKTLAELNATPPSYEDWARNHSHDFSWYWSGCGLSKTVTTEKLVETYLRHRIDEESVPPFPDVDNFFCRMNMMQLGSFVLSSAGKGNLEQWYQNHGLQHHVAHLFSSRDKATALREACERLSIKPYQACYVGDLGADMIAARAAGLIAIGMTRGYNTARALLDCGATLVVKDFEQLSHRLLAA